jgi:hypothetical protein
MALRSIAAGNSRTQRSLPLKVVSRRRRNFGRNIVVLTAVIAFALLITLGGRDQQDVGRCRDSLEDAVTILRERVDSGLPSNFPQPDPENSVAASHYDYRPENIVAEALVGHSAVIGCHATHSLYLDTNGRHVVLYDGKDFEIRWMTETEFQERATNIGLAARAADAD